MFSKEQLALLLNRSLTTGEDANFALYLNIATERLSNILCMDLSGNTGDRTYRSRYGYRTLYIDLCEDVNSVEIDGVVIDDTTWTQKQNDKYFETAQAGIWFNNIEFDTPMTGKKVVIDADWSFTTWPEDLQLLLAKLFVQGSKEQTAENEVKSKKIEDFSVTYKDGATFDELILANSSTIDKYSNCNRGYIRHGVVSRWYHDIERL